jgi:hypothetical protein
MIPAVVLNPSWNVPPDRDERARTKGQAYLGAHHFAHDDDKLVQRRGPDNSLGQVKFVFDNPEGRIRTKRGFFSDKHNRYAMRGAVETNSAKAFPDVGRRNPGTWMSRSPDIHRYAPQPTCAVHVVASGDTLQVGA